MSWSRALTERANMWKSPKNIRESPSSVMRARGQIDEAHERASNRIRSLFERMRMSSMVVDPSRVPVSTSAGSDRIPDRVTASQGLARVRRRLGKISYAAVETVCGQGIPLEEAAQICFGGRARRGEQDFFARLLHEALEELAVYWGYAAPQRDHITLLQACPVRLLRSASAVEGGEACPRQHLISNGA